MKKFWAILLAMMLVLSMVTVAGATEVENPSTGAEGFTITVRDVYVSAGAGFVVALTGAVMTMPGLPKVPAAEKIDVDETGKITGLF